MILPPRSADHAASVRFSESERPTWATRTLRQYDAAALAVKDITPPTIAPEREDLQTVRPRAAGR